MGGWFGAAMCQSNTRLDGKTVIITGANTGIGKESAVELAKRGAVVIMACRDVRRGEDALEEVKLRSGSCSVFLKILDLASIASIRQFSQTFLSECSKLHILINNAGVFMCPYMKTEDGFEMQIGVNHFGHFVLTNLLLKRMVESTPSRVINVSSKAHNFRGATIVFDDINLEKCYSPFFAYQQSKLANVLFTKELNRKIADTGVTTYALCPGTVATEITRHWRFATLFMNIFGRPFAKTPEQGSQTTIYCAVQEGIECESGMYYSDCALRNPNRLSLDEGMAKKLWDISEELTGVKFPLPADDSFSIPKAPVPN